MPRTKEVTEEEIPEKYDSGVLGEFTTAQDFKDGRTYVIESAEITETTDPQDRTKKRLKAIVKFASVAKPTILNETSRKAFANAWGRDMRKWIDKKAIAKVALQNVRGNMTYVCYFNPA
jgi:hypothetical protein